MAPAVASATATAPPRLPITVDGQLLDQLVDAISVDKQLGERPDREPRLGGENLSAVGTEKLVRIHPFCSKKGEAETSPRLGAGVVIILSDYLVLYSHYNQQHLVLTVGPKPEDRYVTNDRTASRTPAHSP